MGTHELKLPVNRPTFVFIKIYLALKQRINR